MELILNGVCCICNENTSVLTNPAVKPYFVELQNAFFDSRSNYLQFQEQLANRTLCALCAEKIMIANLFKNAYEDITRKRGPFKKNYNCCFFCEGENGDLLKINDNPNGFVTKIGVFMKSTSLPSSCEECATCFECFLHANIWFEVFDLINKKKMANRKDVKQLQSTNENTSLIQKDKENVTPPHNNIQTVKRKSQRSVNKLSTTKFSTKNRKMNNDMDTYTKSKKFQDSLRKTLKKFNSLKLNSRMKINWPSNITADSKMYNQIPYVFMLRHTVQPTYRATRKRSRENAMEVIVLSDSDEHSGVKQAPKLLIRRPIKISLSKNFTLDTKKKKVKAKPQHTCLICDKLFDNFCTYKSHMLWHEKPEHFQINLSRYTLPTQIDSNDFPTKRITVSNEQELPKEPLDASEVTEEPSTTKDSHERGSVLVISNTIIQNGSLSSTVNGDVLDSTVRIDSLESSISAPEVTNDASHTDEDTPNDVETSRDLREELCHEVEQNGDESYSEPINLTTPQAHSTMFDGAADDNTVGDVENSMIRPLNCGEKSDGERVGDNENGEVNNCEKTGKKRKWDDTSGIEQNSGDETTPRRKKVRFALDYSTSSTICISDDVENVSENEVDATIVNEV